MFYYAVSKGRKMGVFNSWTECKAQVDGFSGAIYKKFNTRKEAEAFVSRLQPVKVEPLLRKRFVMDWSGLEEMTTPKSVARELVMTIDRTGLNFGQKAAADMVEHWLKSSELCASIAGYAGVGKTFLLSRIHQALQNAGRAVFFCAPTNKAKIVMERRGIEPCDTVHHLVYEYHMEKGVYRKSLRMKPLIANGVIVMDESSMATDEILKALEDYASRFDCKILYVGDPGQLPSVSSPGKKNIRKVFEEFGGNSVFLKQVMRQANGSSILDLATAVRQAKMTIIPEESNGDVEVMASNEAFDQYVSDLKAGIDSTFICATNARRVSVNHRARKALGYGETPVIGEKLIAINNSESFANGEEFILGERRFLGDIVVNGYKGYVYVEDGSNPTYIIVVPSYDSASLSSVENVGGENAWLFKQFNGYCATEYNIVFATYAYAITGHKSQGSQWDHVYVDEAWCGHEDKDRWFYTVVTRAVKKLVVTKNVRGQSMNWNDIVRMAY